MTPVDQTRTQQGEGNCLQACVASIFELPLGTVPDFLSAGDRWFGELERWLEREHGLAAMIVTLGDPPICTQPRGYCIASGPAPPYRKHSVVCRDGEIVHDPHPDRIGLEQIDDLIVFTVPDPIVTG